jgi:hypothetical protein
MQCGASRRTDACAGRLVLGMSRPALSPAGRALAGEGHSEEEGMQITKSIERMVERILGHDVRERFRSNRTPAPARLCEFGHAVFSGNNLCSYGHHAAMGA